MRKQKENKKQMRKQKPTVTQMEIKRKNMMLPQNKMPMRNRSQMMLEKMLM